LHNGVLQAHAPVQTRDEIGDRDIDETGGGKRENIGQRCLHVPDPPPREQCADDHREAGNGIQAKCAQTRPAGIDQDGEIAEFLRDFMRDQGETSRNPQLYIRDERRGQQDTVEKIVKRIAHDDQGAGGFRAMVLMRGVVAVVVRVPPDQGLF
jgi:hypothetical protein